MSLADRIRERLEKVGKSASGASLEAGLSRSAIPDILSGSSTSPRLDTLLKLTKPLQCSIHYLVSDDPETPAAESQESRFRDYSLETVIRDIESGVFRKDWPNDWNARRADAEAGKIAEYAVADDPRLPGRRVHLYRLADTSMGDAGLNYGDILHVAEDGDDQIDLFPGQIVLLQRFLGDGGLSEFAVREVADGAGGIDLQPRPSAGAFDAYTIPYTTFGSANAYRMADGWLAVRGTVCGIYRELPAADDGKFFKID